MTQDKDFRESRKIPKKASAIRTNIGSQVPTRNGTKSWDGTTNSEMKAHPIPYRPAKRIRLNISSKNSKNIEV